MNIFNITSEWAEKNNITLNAHKQVQSTNDLAKAEATKTTHKFVLYLAEHQSGGRGRFERTWIDSGQGNFLLSSWSYKLTQSPSPVVTARIGLSVVEAFNHSFPERAWSLKAPNDIFLVNQKVAGILTEAVTQGDQFRLIIGLGVNVFSSPDIKQASSLAQMGLDITESKWRKFLDTLNDQISKAVPQAHVSELQPPEQSRLLHWLNQNPNLRETYSSIGKDGSLSYQERTIPWDEL